MNTLYLKDSIKSNKTVIAIGSFDGVHAGHAALIKKAVGTAFAVGAEPAVWTFDDYALKSAQNRIMPPENRQELFKELGASVMFTSAFDSVKNMNADEFVKNILIDKCGAEYAVCGYNFRFGKNAASDANDLIKIMRKYGKGGVIIDRVSVDGIPVSSTSIRKALCGGDIKLANNMLGRPFSIEMPVVHGNRIGTGLGYPTINQKYPEGLVTLRYGVYACYTMIDGVKYKAVTNVGVKPTVGAFDVCCESYIIDYGGDLYGRAVTVYFTDFLRDERKFDSLDALKAQIALDVEKVKEMK